MLFRLQKDKEAWHSFYQAIVTKLKSANLEQDLGATEIALNLARWFQPPEADEQVYRDLIDILLASAVANGCAAATDEDGSGICFQIGSVFSILEKYDALRAAPLRRWAERAQYFGSHTTPGPRGHRERNYRGDPCIGAKVPGDARPDLLVGYGEG